MAAGFLAATTADLDRRSDHSEALLNPVVARSDSRQVGFLAAYWEATPVPVAAPLD